ncbi:MAG: bifunctional 2-C-methyl-D-erythritol 4-phosphate cytidylyltransferase/2-C-methyl-D-erythritol 2,4-cyclodiphosphate synthase [Robiginitomaculum sp.]|nr:MAG: bifunctional 2-C-methyl-D-erythritol 4-phosphate cytidylyltransferase/2-C-methyl-D-erythritol 2,4-cyclodiphosphate synthase [Robiginitomaculum sp.]
MKTAVVIVAAGSGTRFGGELPKQYCDLAGQSVLRRTARAFSGHPEIDHVLIVIAKDAQQQFENTMGTPCPAFVFGGASRTQSVQAGLIALERTQPDRVLIHDGARPLISSEDISAVLAELSHFDGCAPAVPIIDAIKQVNQKTGKIIGDADRNEFQRVQTPQGFHYTRLVSAYANLPPDEEHVDDLAVAMAAGMTCKLVSGNPNNLKITTQADLAKANRLMNAKQKIQITGLGFDVHQTCAVSKTNGPMILCGVKVDTELALKGHSDADVGLHALTDAILGAMALGDIGDHFPPSDEQWKNANSGLFLTHAKQLAEQQGGQICHVDITLICEAPKIAPFRLQMREYIADLLGLPLTRVSVKATTTEKLGFTGRGEGIAAQACVTMEIEV